MNPNISVQDKFHRWYSVVPCKNINFCPHYNILWHPEAHYTFSMTHSPGKKC